MSYTVGWINDYSDQYQFPGVAAYTSNSVDSIYAAKEDPNKQEKDFVLAKYSSSGSEMWSTTVSSNLVGGDRSAGLAAFASGIYQTGSTRGDLAGPNQGNIFTASCRNFI
jgi:hypothetical protein